MSHKSLDSRRAFQLHGWRPFHLQQQQQTSTPTSKTLDSSDPKSNGLLVHTKRPCLSNRTTSFSIDAIDMSRLTLVDDDRTISGGHHNRTGSFRFIAKKRRRRGSRSVSGRSSDRSGTRRCCSVGASAAYGTCSDFPVAVGTDSSGELFGNGDANWASDVSEARNSRKERDGGGGSGEKENVGVGFGPIGGFDVQGNESGYGSEPGYRGDAEFGYGDEFDEEEEDTRVLFWGDQFGDADSTMETVGENTFVDQKSHHRCRRKKHDCRMVDALSHWISTQKDGCCPPDEICVCCNHCCPTCRVHLESARFWLVAVSRQMIVDLLTKALSPRPATLLPFPPTPTAVRGRMMRREKVMCFNCQSCKAGLLYNIKSNWKKTTIVNIVFLIFLIVVYSVGCCAFRKSRRDNEYWKQ